jgi:pyridoxal phosphate enzyme (YggS family)
VTAPYDDHRPAELVAALAVVRTRLADAAAAARRDPWSVTLVAVTKTFPASDVSILLGLGASDIGESRDQEARAKLAELGWPGPPVGPSPELGVAPIRLHFIGRLQTNKCRSVARYASCVHTVDRVEVATALAVGVRAAERDRLPVFVQVSLDGDPERGGAPRQRLAALADAVAGQDELALAGVMAVAPLRADPGAAYADLAELSAALQVQHPAANAISAGMSDDFDIAVKNGATHVRIGSALLGRRSDSFG